MGKALKKLVINIRDIILVTLLLALAAVIITTYFLGRGIFIVTYGVVGGILGGLYYGFMQMMANLATTIAIVLLIIGGIYLFLEKNPDIKQRLSYAIQNIENFTYKLSSLQIPFAEDIKQIFGMADKIQKELPGTALTLLQTYGRDAIPSELSPLLNVQLDPSMMNRWENLLSSGKLTGGNIDGAVPLLADALKSQDDSLRGAAFQALKSINSSDAQRAIRNYEQYIKEALGNAHIQQGIQQGAGAIGRAIKQQQ